jgi:hypothetical protein
MKPEIWKEEPIDPPAKLVKGGRLGFLTAIVNDGEFIRVKMDDGEELLLSGDIPASIGATH